MKRQYYLKCCMALLMAVMSYTSVTAANITGSIYENGIKYDLYDDHTATVSGWDISMYGRIIIPEYIVDGNTDNIFSVTSIGRYAFKDCTFLKSVEMNSVTSIGSDAFIDCTSLESVEMNNATSIGHAAFGNCTALQSVAMSRVTSIGEYAFSGCKSLPSFEMNNVTSIGVQAFSGCTALQSVEINNVIFIESSTFAGCTSLQSVAMNRVTSIGESAFSGCKSLPSFEMNNVTSIGRYAFIGCTALQSVEMNSVTSIGEQTFRGCTALQSVEMSSVTSIGWYAFIGCTALQSVEMNSVTSIDVGAFSGCTALKSVEMNSVTSIGDNAFRNCSDLKSIRLLNPTPPSLESLAFVGVSEVSVTIPFKSKAKYIEEWGCSPAGGSGFLYHWFDSAGEAMNLEMNNTAGQLMNNISINDLPNIWSMTLSGEINGSDLNVINRMDNLERLDLSNCRVVAGGASYYRKDNYEYFTKDDILGEYSLRIAILDSIAYPQVTEIKESAVLSLGRALSYAVVPSTVTTLYYTTHCRNYVFLYGDNNMLTSTGISSIEGAKKVELGRPVSNIAFFLEVSSSLEEVTITYPYIEFYDGFFSHCSKLTTFKIPASVQKIGERTFYGCTGLKEVICCAQTPPSANADSFDESTYKKATLYVPVGTRTAYFFDPVWGMFNNIEEGLPLGVSDVMVEDIDGPVSVYDLQGIQRYHGERDAMPTLPRGVYIIRTANGRAEKVMM